MTGNKEANDRRPYEKPGLTKVDLVLDEVLMNVTCKTGGTIGPVQQNCRGSVQCEFQNPS